MKSNGYEILNCEIINIDSHNIIRFNGVITNKTYLSFMTTLAQRRY